MSSASSVKLALEKNFSSRQQPQPRLAYHQPIYQLCSSCKRGLAQHPKKAIPIDEFERYGIYHDRVRRKCVAVPSQQSELRDLSQRNLH